MDFYFSLVAILLILDVVSTQSADGSSKEVQLSSGIASNPFLQSINFPNAQNQNPFLQPVNNNQNGNPFLSNSFISQSNVQYPLPTQRPISASNTASSNNNYNPFLNIINNAFLKPIITNSRFPFLNPIITNSRFYIDSSSPRPSMQSPYTPPPSPVRTISEIKCDEYVGQIAGTTSITSLTGSSSTVLRVNNVCENVNRLVVGGTEARVGEFPHMVALGRQTPKFILMCGGTLISRTWVLTAAHCTHGPEGDPTHVRIGFHRFSDEEGITVDINNMIRHPDYEAPAMYHDIALVQLKNDITFDPCIKSACLYQQHYTMPKKAWVSGWGVTTYNGEISDRLQKAQLDLIENLPCKMWYHNTSSIQIPHGITPNMICAGDVSNWIKDTCEGDSGGPLQVRHPKSNYHFQVIGITSFGQGCAMIDIPAVYTRVSHYLPWIEDIVWPQGQ